MRNSQGNLIKFVGEDIEIRFGSLLVELSAKLGVVGQILCIWFMGNKLLYFL